MSHKVFIGSTSRDLADYRQAAIDTCLRLNLHPIAMEYFTAMPMGATEGSKKKVEDSDWYVGIFAHRYGYIEDGYDQSVTEIEFDYAGERAIPRLCFVADPAHKGWSADDFEKDHPAKLAAFKARIDKTLIRAQFTDVNDFALKLSQALTELKGEYFRPASTSAVLATDADAIPGKTAKFRGRTTFITEIQTALDNGERVLIQGFGGMGKTALAAECAAGHVPVLWVKAGSDSVDAVFEALARPLNAHQVIASVTGEAKIATMRQLLHQSGVKLLLVDDVWDGKTLHALLEAIPAKIKVLVTSRDIYPLDERVHLDELPPDEALEVLRTYGGKNGAGAGAAELCHLLGYHAFALEIAGALLKVDSLTPAELHQKIQDAPYKMKMPLEFAKAGREGLQPLLEASLNALDETSRQVFLAFGALFTGTATAEMLALYLETPPSPAPSPINGEGGMTPPLPSWDAKAGQGGEGSIETALTTLIRRGLVEKMPATDERSLAYRIHDLAYSYARAQTTLEQQLKAMEACLAYTRRYNEPKLENFKALRPELDNFMAAAALAMAHERWQEAERFAWNLYANSEFLSYRGFYTQAITLLEQAALAAEKQGKLQNQGAHLTHLGLCLANLGQYHRAIAYYEQAVEIDRQLGDKKGEGADLGNLGNAYSSLGETSKAIEYYEQALTIAREIGDKRGEGSRLGNLGSAYADLGEYGKAIAYYEQALTIAREIGDKRNEGNWLGGLGNAYKNLGEYHKAIAYYEQALTIARAIGDKRGEGNRLGNLGNAYRNLGEYGKAMEYYEQDLAIRNEIGDMMGKANVLNNIGTLHDDQQHYPLALQFYQQARDIRAALGLTHMVEKSDRNIAKTRAKMAGDA